MLLPKAQQYLREVIARTRCVPFTKYDGATGRTAQAQEWGLTHGRWPEKSCRILLSLLQNLSSNADIKKCSSDKLIIKTVRVNAAALGRRRTFRAHGRINGNSITKNKLILQATVMLKLSLNKRERTLKKRKNNKRKKQ